MSLFSIFAPTSTDQEYCAQLINELTVRNSDDTCVRLKELLEGSQQISRKDILPLLPKIASFIETNNYNIAIKLVTVLSEAPQKYFKEADLKDLMAILISNQGLQRTEFSPLYLSICEKALMNVHGLVDDVMDLAPFASLASDPRVTSFLVRVAQLVPELRVPFVFAGLIEQILPTIDTNEIHLALLASLIADPQSRQYFADMGHIPRLISVLFDLNISSLATSAFRSLLDPADLIHLNGLQRKLFELGVPKQLVIAMTLENSSDETVRNAALCIADCIQYLPLDELPFSVDSLLNVMLQRPGVQSQILYIFENLAISNPHLFPMDSEFLGKPVMPKDPCTILYMSYLSYDCHRQSELDVRDFAGVKDHALSLLLAVGVQRRIYIEGAELIAQMPENETHRQLASANCFVTGSVAIPKSTLVHYACVFFQKNIDTTNPHISRSKGTVDVFYPQSLLAWGQSMFSPVNRGRLIHASGTWSMTKPAEQIDISPDEAHANLLTLNNKANEILRDNDLWRAKYEALENRHAAMMKDYSHLETQLIESKCQQMIMRKEKI